MSKVIHGICPDCGESTDGPHAPPPLGALCYETPPIKRVAPCKCGSFNIPIPYEAVLRP
jgi:hypothetical protein